MEESIPSGFTQQAERAFNKQLANPDPKTAANLTQEMEQARLESYRQDTHERRTFARYIFWMVALWLLGIFAVVVCRGIKALNFELSDTVMVALITTTTINVAAFFLAVTKYLFPSKPEPANGV